MKALAALFCVLSAVSARSVLPVESIIHTVPNDLTSIIQVNGSHPSDFANMIDINGSLASLPDIMYFPDDNGDPQPGKVMGTALWVPGVQQADVFFTLYTRNGPRNGTILIPGDEDSVKNSKFNASEPTFIVTHGYMQSIESNTIRTIKDMYLAYKRGNLIAVDWSKISKHWLYYIVKIQTVQVGQFVAAMVAFLAEVAGVKISDVHLCGHSLGSHVVGIAGKNIRIIVGKKPGRITGLDPAGPLYSVLDREHRLDRGDGDFVDVIHTCGGWLGMHPAIGHVDFYPNGGTMRQPGCSLDFVTAGMCSHSRSWEFFAESLNSQSFSSRACSTYVEYERDNCNESPRVPMGQDTPNSTRGNYYLKTAKFAPYAMG